MFLRPRLRQTLLFTRTISGKRASCLSTTTTFKSSRYFSSEKKVETPEEMVLVERHPSDPNFVNVTLNRPHIHNAFNDVVIQRLRDILVELKSDNETTPIRGVFFRGNGKSFSAGGDLDWMKQAAQASDEANRQDALKLSSFLRELNAAPFPCIALVNGAAFGGGVGLISCCDMAFSVSKAVFALSEVKLGLTPATISPYVVGRIGSSQARRYFLTAETFNATKAQEIGLVHDVVEDLDALAELETQLMKDMTNCAPRAVQSAKELIFAVQGNKVINDDLLEDTANRLSKVRGGGEAKEGIKAFLSRQKPSWMN